MWACSWPGDAGCLSIKTIHIQFSAAIYIDVDRVALSTQSRWDIEQVAAVQYLGSFIDSVRECSKRCEHIEPPLYQLCCMEVKHGHQERQKITGLLFSILVVFVSCSITSGSTRSETRIVKTKPSNHLCQHWFDFDGFFFPMEDQ